MLLLKTKICKKYILHLVVSVACLGLIGLIFSPNTFAAYCSGVDTAILDCEEGGDGGIFYVLSLILNIMTIGVGILAVIGISWMGIQYLTAGGDITRTVKAKRRLFEIVIGLVCYASMFGLISWLLPDGADINDDNTNVDSISILYSGKTYVGETFVPVVTFNKEATDKTYSLKSNSTQIVQASGRGAKCLEVGKASIEAISANGKKASLSVNCREKSVAKSSSDEGNSKDNTTGSQVNVKLNGKTNMRKETKNIINDHRMDFNVNNYDTKIKKYGGYTKYVKSLGGVFAKYASKKKIKVKTAADFQEAAEYVWGLMTIWGGDYSGGSFYAWRNNKPWKNGKSDRFRIGWSAYLGQWGSRWSSIDKRLKDKSVSFVCSTMMGTFIASTSLPNDDFENYGLHSSSSESLYKKYGGKITRADRLKVGDVIFFSQGAHVAIVGEVYKDYVIIYDGGSRFPRNDNYKYKLKRVKSQSGSVKGTTYSGNQWLAFRPWKIDQSVTLKGIN